MLKLHKDTATFLRLPRLAAELEAFPPGASLHVDFEHLDYIDHACIDLLLNWATQHESDGGRLTIDWDSLHARFRSESRRELRRQPLADDSSRHQTSSNHIPATAQAHPGRPEPFVVSNFV